MSFVAGPKISNFVAKLLVFTLSWWQTLSAVDTLLNAQRLWT